MLSQVFHNKSKMKKEIKKIKMGYVCVPMLQGEFNHYVLKTGIDKIFKI